MTFSGMGSMQAEADWNDSVGRGISLPGFTPYGDFRLGPHYVETPSINGTPVEEYPLFCVNAKMADPGRNEMVSIATLTDSYKWGPDEFDLETPQMAYLLNKYQRNTKDDVNLAALSYLIHLNFEQPKNGFDAQKHVNELVEATRRQAPQAEERARQYVQEARNSAAVGYESGAVEGDGKRVGNIHNIGIHPDNNNIWLAGYPITVTLNGPAVFDATGTNTWTGTTSNQPVSLSWSSTGNGVVSASWIAQTPHRRTLTRFGANGQVQDMLSYGNRPASDPVEVTVPGPSWRVMFDFQPQGVSHVEPISDDGSFTDSFTASANPTYGDGQWLVLDGKPVPVTYKVTAYYAGLTPPVQGTVPDGAEVIGSQTVTAKGPGELKASFTAAKPGFATVVWQVVKADQPEQYRELIHGDWSDGYGVADETVSYRHKVEIDSSAAVRDTKSGSYLVDDVWVKGFPADHGSFAGDGRFKADVASMVQRLVFFPESLEVSDENVGKAELIGEVTVPAKNGFYPSLGSNDFRVKTDDQGKLVAGTYVFITVFDGDSRVAPLTTSATDTTEQFRVKPEPDIHTTLMYEGSRDPVPGYGTRTLTDVVAYTQLEPGKEYTVTGTLMDKATSKPLTDATGKPITSSATFTPETANGTVKVEFTVDAALFAGKETVAFETLSREGRDIVIHADIEDKDQTIPFEPSPELKTTASDKADGDKTVKPEPDQVIHDRVCDARKSLKPGTRYEIVTALMLSDGSPVVDESGNPVTVTTVFVPSSADECAEVDISFNASKLAGKKVVVFEDVLHDGVTVGVHHDLSDEDQTVEVGPKPPTPPVPPTPGLPHTGASAGVLAGSAAAFIAGGVWLLRRKLVS
ncbi:VaFE repeat-containing surface-anchored protein [Trueperella sp. LYQ143]|uniref:VaFE repeat-containing surface-anchored protein n=1 Tax=Trueperella sp. LYQ143 TaxID=3391059 RepID=UPI00398301D0